MPKIIENLPQRLLEEARHQLTEMGCATLNIRTVAKNCGVGVGTVYNYYPSKDALIAEALLLDWRECLARIRAVATADCAIEPVMQAVYRELTAFYRQYENLFHAAQAEGVTPQKHYHIILRGQISEVFQPFCPDKFTADFLAEAFLVWSVEGVPYSILRDLLLRVL